MKRLTKTYPSGYVTLDASHFPPYTQDTLDREINAFEPFRIVVEKLKEYEDKVLGEEVWRGPVDAHTTALREIIAVYEENIAPITSIVMHSMFDWLNDMDAEVIKWAIAEAVKNNKRSWKYIEGILRNHFAAGRTTMAAVQDAQRSYKAQPNGAESVYNDDGIDYEALEQVMQERG